MRAVVRVRAHFHRSFTVILFVPCAFQTVSSAQQHAKLRLGVYKQESSVGRARGVGKVGRCRRRVALHLRDRLADIAVCLPRRLLAGLVAVVYRLAAGATKSGHLAITG